MKSRFLIRFFLVSLSLFLNFVFEVVSAQDMSSGSSPVVKQDEDAQLLYRNEQEFGALVHSAGWGFNYRRCKHVTGYRKRIIEAEIVGMRHPKEIKIQVPDIGTKGYFYGKQFVVTVARGGFGTGGAERYR